jgi:hypothetical protein
MPSSSRLSCSRVASSASPIDYGAEEVARRVEVRMTRQHVLTREDRPQLWAIMDESIVHKIIGGPG